MSPYASDYLIHEKCGRKWGDHVYEKREFSTECICPVDEKESEMTNTTQIPLANENSLC